MTEHIMMPYAFASIVSNGHCINNGSIITSSNTTNNQSTPAIDVDEPSEESCLLENGHQIKDPHLLTVPTVGIRARTHNNVGDFDNGGVCDVKTASKSFPVIDPPKKARRRRNTEKPPGYTAPSNDGDGKRHSAPSTTAVPPPPSNMIPQVSPTPPQVGVVIK